LRHSFLGCPVCLFRLSFCILLSDCAPMPVSPFPPTAH
jgi:hypothetical protein